MKKVIILMAMMTAMLTYVLTSCYKHKEDILALPKVSFRGDVVPIMVSGGCGCHSNGTTRAVQFAHADTIFYDAILARISLLENWVKGGTHPGSGNIYFKPNEANMIANWIEQGGKDDGGGCTVTGVITHTADIQPIYTTTCKGSTCHGGIAVTLDYDKLVADKTILNTILNTGGSSGHPGGTLSLGTCTVKTLQEWIAQGQLK